jgi:tetratricopeptide (TPR) repeat protein
MTGRFKQRNLIILSLIGLSLALIVNLVQIPPLQAQEFPLEQAKSYYQSGQYREVISLLENSLNAQEGNVSPEIYRYLGLAYYQAGHLGQAIRSWDKAIKSYRSVQTDSSRRQIAGILSEQAQAYIGLGQNQKAIELATEAVSQATQVREPKLLAQSQGILGNAYLQSGQKEKALEVYLQTLKSATISHSLSLSSAALNNLTIVSNRLAQKYTRDAQLARQEKDELEMARLSELAERHRLEARQYAFQAVEVSQRRENLTAVRALLNLLPWISSSEKESYRQKALAILEKLPASRSGLDLLINLAKIDSKDGERIRLLEQSIQIAQTIGDERGLSFALGELGKVYQEAGDYQQALSYIQQAQLVAQQISAYDSLYRWWWLAGRIYRAIGLLEESKAAYRSAIASVQKIRGDIATASKEFQLDFRDEIEPVYREFLELLLSQEQPEQLQEGLDTFETLQLATLESFFGDICVEVIRELEPQQLLAQTDAATITSIILPKVTHLVLQRPDGGVRPFKGMFLRFIQGLEKNRE